MTRSPQTPSNVSLTQRRWASGRQPSVIEQLSSAYRALLPDTVFLRILPAAVDANVLLNTIARIASSKPAVLVDAARLGLVRLYVGETIWSEAERNLSSRAQQMRVPTEVLRNIWEA